jgi:hypothetical protein
VDPVVVPYDDGYRLITGGAYSTYVQDARVSHRATRIARHEDRYIGLRIVRRP